MNFSPSVIGMERCNNAGGGIVKQGRAHSNFATKLKVVGGTEERFVLPDRFTFVSFRSFVLRGFGPVEGVRVT